MAEDKKFWWIIIDREPLNGSLNMAIDEFLFQSLKSSPGTFLRFYRWKNPTVSLGYSQKMEKVVDESFCRQNGIDIVRRMTGGKLVLHHKEITYSVSSSDNDLFTSRLKESYKLISKALIKGMEKMGLRPYLARVTPDLYKRGTLPCFSYPAQDEVEIDGKKIIGSAQKREGNRFIQHGSIPMEDESELLRGVSLSKNSRDDVRMISLYQALGTNISFDKAVDCFKEGMIDYFRVEMSSKLFSEKERKIIEKIQAKKYSSQEWTRERRLKKES
ncbi:MAG: lipoate--protein ligase family protein [Candidatus Aminicenantaceae bacterium]